MWVFLCPIVTKLNYFTLFLKINDKMFGSYKIISYLCIEFKIKDNDIKYI